MTDEMKHVDVAAPEGTIAARYHSYPAYKQTSCDWLNEDKATLFL